MDQDRNMSLPSMDSLLGFGPDPLLQFGSQPLLDNVLESVPSFDWPELHHDQVAAAANRAMEAPLQPDTLFGASYTDTASVAPSMQQLQSEHEEQLKSYGRTPYGYSRQQQGPGPQPQPQPQLQMLQGSLSGGDPRFNQMAALGPHQQHQQQHLLGQQTGYQRHTYGSPAPFLQAQQQPLPQPLPPFLEAAGAGAGGSIPSIGGSDGSGYAGSFPGLPLIDTGGGGSASAALVGHDHRGAPAEMDHHTSGSSGNLEANCSGSWGTPPSRISAAANPLAAAGADQPPSRRDDGGATSAALHVEDKKLKIKEKNRRAQQRFRERQRQKLAESQERSQALRASITQLQIEHELLVARNTMLEKFKSVRQLEEREAEAKGPQLLAAPSSDSEEEPQASGNSASQLAMSMDIQKGDRPKVEGAALVLTILETQHVTLTTDQIKRMRWEEHVKIWKEYVNKLAELLVEARSDPEAEAGKRAAVLVREAVTLAATISIHNPRGYRTWHCNRMETGTAEADLPTRDFWYNIMKCLKMPAEQRSGMRQLRRLYLGRLGDVTRKRQAVAARLQPRLSAIDGGRGTIAEYLKVVDITEQLQANLVEEHKLLQMFMINISFRIGRPLQAASVIVQAYPWAPDMLAIINCLAEEEGDPSASELLSMGYEAAVGLQGGKASASDASL